MRFILMKKMLLISILVLISIPVFSLEQQGKNLFLFGDSAISLGRGGTGVSESGTNLFYYNPASIAGLERVGVDINYGTLPIQTNYYNPDISFAIPTSYGVFGTAVRALILPESTDFNQGYAISFGGAKEFTPQILIGFSLDLFYGNSGIFYTGATIGSIYKFKVKNNKKGFGFFDPRAGFSLNFGVPIGGADANFNSLTLGYDFKFYKTKKYNFGFYNDFSTLDFYREFPIKAGLETEILNKYVIRTGMVFPQYYDYGDFTFGLGYKLKSQNYIGSINYSVVYYKDKTFLHYLGAKLEYGKLDREAPNTKIKPDRKYISPNNDGIKDYVRFDLDVEDKSRIKGWKLLIINSNGKIVKEFKQIERDIVKGLTFKTFFTRLIQKRESLVVPADRIWDGRDSKQDIVPDGNYTYSFNAWDEKNNIAVVKKGTVIVDNTPPQIKVSSNYSLFSPNGDKQKDELIITQKIETTPEDIWKAEIKNNKGDIIKSFKWTGSTIPSTIKWDGKNKKGKDVPEGLYSYSIKSADKAGNKAAELIKEISLTRAYEIVDIILESDYFSFLLKKDFKLKPVISKKEGLLGWNAIIYDSDNKIIKEIKGNNDIPKEIIWNCKDQNGEKLEDGKYFIKLTTKFDSGNTPASFLKMLLIDSTPPELDISHDPDLFSPDNDGENDILIINTEVKEKFGIKEWTINIYEPSGKVFKKYSGTGIPPKEIIWNGLSDSKEIVESAADYFIELQAVDRAGNKTISKKDVLHIDILVIVTTRGLKMRISNIEFRFDSARLTKKGKRILKRVYQILVRYQNYNIIIEGHTDSIGSEEYNLKLSEKRSNAVRKFLIKQGMDKNLFEFIGMGETVPLYKNNTIENRRKNRRVEFLLIKQTDEENIDMDKDEEDEENNEVKDNEKIINE
jgi:outer membrane protein OmpA-like peptidoglycan-associated protein/flagellar hook assembly protein FlgD